MRFLINLKFGVKNIRTQLQLFLLDSIKSISFEDVLSRQVSSWFIVHKRSSTLVVDSTDAHKVPIPQSHLCVSLLLVFVELFKLQDISLRDDLLVGLHLVNVCVG
jgi:hypothetical protein